MVTIPMGSTTTSTQATPVCATVTGVSDPMIEGAEFCNIIIMDTADYDVDATGGAFAGFVSLTIIDNDAGKFHGKQLLR